jgi:hypothetical protein
MEHDLWYENEGEQLIYRLTQDEELLVYNDNGELVGVTQIIRRGLRDGESIGKHTNNQQDNSNT